MTLLDLAIGSPAHIRAVGGERSFRRRLLEFGLIPGTEVKLLRVAPFGDPVELLVRGCHLSIRRHEASELWVEPLA